MILVEPGDYLKCIKQQAVWWGTVYDIEKTYQVIDVVYYKKSYIDPNNSKKYWSYNQMMMKVGQEIVDIHKSIKSDIISDTQNELRKRFDYLVDYQNKIKSKIKEFVRTTDLPFCVIKSEMENQNDSFLLVKKSELLSSIGTTEFQTTTYFIEDYFDIAPIERDKKLTKLGI